MLTLAHIGWQDAAVHLFTQFVTTGSLTLAWSISSMEAGSHQKAGILPRELALHCPRHPSHPAPAACVRAGPAPSLGVPHWLLFPSLPRGHRMAATTPLSLTPKFQAGRRRE